MSNVIEKLNELETAKAVRDFNDLMDLPRHRNREELLKRVELFLSTPSAINYRKLENAMEAWQARSGDLSH